MTLTVFVNDPAADPADIVANFIEPTGFESDRRQLWGTDAVRRLTPMLADIAHDVYVQPEEFDEFERQSRILAEQPMQ